MFQGKQAENGHAWNIVTIDGKNYPIDLTWDSCKFRGGESKTFDFLGQDVKKFEKNHVPRDQEPCKNYVLSELDPKLIQKISSRFSREKEYESTTYYKTRKDGSRYMIAQVGDCKIGDKNCYRYYYADLEKDGTPSNPSILYSETNIAHFVDAVQWNKATPPGYEEAIDNVLFSKENINDSLKRGTGYIGKVTKEKKEGQKDIQLVKSPSDIFKPQDKQQQLQYPTKVFKRNDGSTFIAQKMNNGENANGTQVMTFHIFEVIKENGKNVVKRNVVFSEKDFFQDNRAGIANEYLSRARLDRKNKESAGYLGYYDEKGIRTYDSNLVQFFKTTHKIKPTSKKEQTNQTESKFIQLTEGQAKRKKEWIKQFMENYKASSTMNEALEGLRFYEENENLRRVVSGINSGKFDMTEELTVDVNTQPVQEYKAMEKLARLLIEADNLTIDGGEDYLEKFSNIPAINKLLLQLKNSSSVKEMQEKANEARKNGTYPKNYKLTRAEIDKKLAQQYLSSGNLTKSTILEEISYRRGLSQRDKIKVVSDEKYKSKIPIIIKQQISLIRVLARQSGKIPSKLVSDEKIGWYFATDEQPKTQPNVSIEEIVNGSSIDKKSLSYDSVVTSTLNAETTKDEIQEVMSEIRNVQTRELQQAQQR